MIEDTYPINDIYASIQGEGQFTGYPMVIVRVQGCGAGCSFCDTKETWRLVKRFERQTIDQIKAMPELWGEFNSSTILDFITRQWPPLDRVLLTGGEPALYRMHEFVTQCYERGISVHLETGGVIPLQFFNCDWVCVSPKPDNVQQKPVLREVLQIADELKVVIADESDINEVDGYIKYLKDGALVFLQPVSYGREATKLCVQTAMENNWNVSIQVHKLINLP